MSEGRRFTSSRRVHLGDASTRGRIRLDAIARFVQDVAADDAAEAHLPDNHGWVVRRLEMTIRRRPVLYEDVELTTWCGGCGARWAERSTRLTTTDAHGEPVVAVDARAIWVYVNLETGSPEPLPDEFFAMYGDHLRQHLVRARLTHPAPPDGAARRPWVLRTADFDVLGHVNNAAYWAPVEELADGARIERAEIEFRAGLEPGDEPFVLSTRDGDDLAAWFVVDDEVRASVRLGLARAASF